MKKTIYLAGPAGGGLNSIQYFIEKSFHKKGYYYFSYKNYMSRVRGGLNIICITLGDEPQLTFEDRADFLVTLDHLSEDLVLSMLKEGGTVLELDKYSLQSEKSLDIVQFVKADIDQVFNHPNAYGMVAFGYLAKVFGLDADELSIIHMPKWSEKVNEANKASALFGFEKAEKRFEAPKRTKYGYRMGGNQATALGALAGGLNFFAAYPMAPSTGILQYLTNHEKTMHIFTEQVEDEIASVLSALGAASAGAKAMTASSGGGFALMTEGIGLAGIAETPVVIVNVMRPGPATGLPTRTEQADFFQALGAAQGEFPRVILAPDSIEDCLYTTNRAMDLAHKYRVPVIVLTDQYLADSTTEIMDIDWTQLKNENYLAEKGSPYQLYDVNTLAGNAKYSGYDGSILLFDSHIHLEDGFYSESGAVTNRYKKRVMDKLDLLRKELNKPRYYGSETPEVLFVSWGSNKDVILEAMKQLPNAALLHFTDLYPLDPAYVEPYFNKARTIINVEMNAFNQFGKYLRMESGFHFDHSINRYDGRPLSASFILKALEDIHESL